MKEPGFRAALGTCPQEQRDVFTGQHESGLQSLCYSAHELNASDNLASLPHLLAGVEWGILIRNPTKTEERLIS